MTIKAPLKAGEIEGLRELISQVILEERDKIVPMTILQDVEEIKRSPVGAVIRMEGSIERLEKDVTELKRTAVTKEELANLERVMNARFQEIEQVMRVRFGELEKRMDILRLAFFAFLALQLAILVKLFL